MALTTNCVAYYKLDESSGNAADSVGSNTLTNIGTVPYSAGKINNGADGGTGANTRTLGSATAAITYAQMATGWTISYWVKPNATLTGTIQYWGGVFANNGSQTRYLFVLFHTSTNNIVINTGDSVGNTYFPTGLNPASGTWYHITYTYDGSNIRTYYNGGNKVTTPFTFAAGFAATYNATGVIGDPVNLGSTTKNAMVDEYGFWTRALSDAEVTSLYNSGSGLQYPFTGGTTVNSNFLAFM